MTTDALAARPAVDPGNDFEQRFFGLLRRRYSVQELVFIPADMGGDCGIEGYSRDGIAYQCYADRDSLTLRHRTDKQIAKLNRDTLKIQKYQTRLAEVLGRTRIKAYILGVPEYHAAELITHANKRADVVKGWGIPFIDPSFTIGIKTPVDYPAELSAALADRAAEALLPATSVDDAQVDRFHGDEPQLVHVLDEKLSVMRESLRNPASLRRMFVRDFLRKEQLMLSLKSWPHTWEAVERRRVARQEEIEFDNELSSDPAKLRIKDLIQQYRSELLDAAGGLRYDDANLIARGQVGGWLMDCPLELRGTDGI
ncbi:hypothetical protein OHA21_45895 [Actinoplanes sp. NBC_00393]|uniref:hypothetical protein n=1 Tax=Actinoplanes sp. NBC_00393 TaxID=2975953 RepID=UPI002E216708